MTTNHFCTCQDHECKCNPRNHADGCDLCIKKCLAAGEIPSCFFKDISEDISKNNDFTYQGFISFFQKNKANK